MRLTTSLDRAKQLFSFALAGWDTNPGDPDPGGVYWVNQGVGYGLTNHDRGTGAPAGYDGDGSVSASPPSLGASNMVNWVQSYVDSTQSGSGLYWNVVRSDGSIDTNIWSYNQGVMIGANVLRYQLTNNSAYLSQATATANKVLS